MEYSLLSACVCLLLGCCIQDNDQFRQSLSNILPDHSFKPLIEELKKLRDFAHLAVSRFSNLIYTNLINISSRLYLGYNDAKRKRKSTKNFAIV